MAARELELVARVGQLTGALDDLPLQIRVGLLQSRAHPVELLRQILELVAGAYRDPLLERARTDAGRARANGVDGDDHPAGEGQACDHGDDQCKSEQSSRAQQRGVERGERLVGGLLHEDSPAGRRNDLVGREHGSPGDVSCHHGSLLERCAAADRGLHLRERRKIGVPKDGADVGVPDQLSG